MLIVHNLDTLKIFSDSQYKQEVISNLKKGEIYIQRKALKVNTVEKLKEYLFGSYYLKYFPKLSNIYFNHL